MKNVRVLLVLEKGIHALMDEDTGKIIFEADSNANLLKKMELEDWNTFSRGLIVSEEEYEEIKKGK